MAGMGEEFDRAVGWLPPELCRLLLTLPPGERARIQEVRLRAGRPLAVFDGEGSRFVTREGGLTGRGGEGFPVDKALLHEAFLRLCDYSVHTHQGELEQGFVTTPGGDRVGVAAAVSRDREGTPACREISSLSLRVSREVPGAGGSLPGSGTPVGASSWPGGRGQARPPSSGTWAGPWPRGSWAPAGRWSMWTSGTSSPPSSTGSPGGIPASAPTSSAAFPRPGGWSRRCGPSPRSTSSAMRWPPGRRRRRWRRALPAG